METDCISQPQKADRLLFDPVTLSRSNPRYAHALSLAESVSGHQEGEAGVSARDRLGQGAGDLGATRRPKAAPAICRSVAMIARAGEYDNMREGPRGGRHVRLVP